MKFLQKIGKSLMLPIASLPVAALLLRLGVMLDTDLAKSMPQAVIVIGTVIQSGGNALFSNLGLIFAVGVAIGFSKDQHGSSALAAVIGYLVLFNVLGSVYKILNPSDLSNTDLTTITDLTKYKAVAAAQISGYSIPALGMSGFGGPTIFPAIVIGIISGTIYNKFKDVKLPSALSFFGGKRLVPLLTSIVAIFLGIVFAFVMPLLAEGVKQIAIFMNNTKPYGFFVYGLFNRLLIPTGLHHVVNTFFWFTTGHCANNPSLQGDITMFLNHCEAAKGFATPGSFQAGFFPIMMFGLPGAAIAIALSAKPERRAEMLGLMGGVALVSFLTGVTEPIEFSFMFVSPVLFGIHAILTGLSLFLTNLLHMYHGFGFSAGLLDYLLNFTIAKNPLGIAAIGVAMFAIYFFTFKFVITAFDLKTPGREDEVVLTEEQVASAAAHQNDSKAAKIYAALGGKENVVEVNNCTTRLRLVVKDVTAINQSAIKAAGAMGQVKVSDTEYQVIIGTDVEFIADEMRTF